ncbi:MAG: AAA family ATPase [Verrucomicrobiota bacterium]|jgi:hypothetical protein
MNADPANPRPVPFTPDPTADNVRTPGAEECRAWGILRPRDFRQWEPPEGHAILGPGCLSKGWLIYVSGMGNLGKTTLAVGLAAADVRRDPDFCGLPILPSPEPRNWLFISNENGRERWKHDCADVERGLAPDALERWERQIHVADIADAEDMDISLPGSAHLITQAIRDARADIVILDPWNGLTSDEIDSRNHASTLRHLFVAVRRGNPAAAVVVVAHAKAGLENTARAGGRFDGGSSVRGNAMLHLKCRFSIHLAPFDDAPGGDLVMQFSKHNNVNPAVVDIRPRRIRLDRAGLRYSVVETVGEEWKERLTAKTKTPRKGTPEDVWKAVNEKARTQHEVFQHLRRLPNPPSLRTVVTLIGEAVELGYVLRLPPKQLGLGPNRPA